MKNDSGPTSHSTTVTEGKEVSQVLAPAHETLAPLSVLPGFIPRGKQGIIIEKSQNIQQQKSSRDTTSG